MNTEPLREITADEINTFEKDGVVCLRGLFDGEWVEFLREQVDADIANPSQMNKDVNAKDSTGNFFADSEAGAPLDCDLFPVVWRRTETPNT